MPTILTNDLEKKLVQAAVAARRQAYAPYSHYQVGAALLAGSGEIYLGVNVENAAYPMTMCAERSAVFTAVTAGESRFIAIAVATRNAGTPCGACRQVLAEFGLDTVVLIVNSEAQIVHRMTVAELLPGAFLPGDLNTAAG